MADWQTYEDFPTWRHAVKFEIIPMDILLFFEHNADSTKEEAQKLLRFVQERGIKSVILVTSHHHTRRAKKVFQGEWAGSGVRLYVSAAGSSQYHPDG